MSSRILLVEDDTGLVLTLSDLLASEGYEVESASDGPSGQALATSRSFDLIILDIMLPGKSGLEVCRAIRQQGLKMPILMLTAKTQVVDRVVGLKLGADDYLGKPFDPSELLARVEALMRRAHPERFGPSSRCIFGKVVADFEKAEVLKDGQAVMLATKEFQLLQYLVDNRGRVVSRDELLKEVWGYQPDVNSRTVDVHVAWLRQKLEESPQFPRHIVTVRGSGYRFNG
jgi:two-component system alkaline phosphatase synthesis response regulator PhoP